MFKLKYKVNSSIERFKARLIAQGYSQMHRIDYTEMFASTIRQESLRIFLTIVTILGIILFQMDILSAYLESLLGQDNHLIYMRILQRCKIG